MIQTLKKLLLFFGYFFVTTMLLTTVMDAEMAGRLCTNAMVGVVSIYFWSEISWKARKLKESTKLDLLIALVVSGTFGFILGQDEKNIDSAIATYAMSFWSTSWLFLYNFYIVGKFWGIKNSARVGTKIK